MSIAVVTPSQRLTWYKSRNGQRLFLIVGIWHSNDPTAEQVELLELYRSVPITHSRQEFINLVEAGELVRI